jgi:hypothetical protein
VQRQLSPRGGNIVLLNLIWIWIGTNSLFVIFSLGKELIPNDRGTKRLITIVDHSDEVAVAQGRLDDQRAGTSGRRRLFSADDKAR